MNSYWTKGTQRDLRSLYRLSGKAQVEVADDIEAWTLPLPQGKELDLLVQQVEGELIRRQTCHTFPVYPFDSEGVVRAIVAGYTGYIHTWDEWSQDLKRLGYEMP